MFTKLLIANRGEIACRIIDTAKKMGVRTVAVYSDADSNARHVAMADEAFYLGASAPAQSYLRGDAIIEVAKRAGAQAIHPGYGFLSENAEFARQCEQSGIEFVGPGSDAIDSMGSKSAAKVIMSAANVPLVPGYHGDDQTDDVLLKEAHKVGYPQLIKAAYGGGGKGMRIVENQSELQGAIDSARREAASSFGNDKLLMERYLRQPRHVEVQVFADKHGNCVYLSDRDCSVQRRHQKVVEEAPAPGLSDDLRKQMGEAAVAAAKAIDYVGAGTVEFLLDTDGSFYFMEMNTRLQVEHPVTELVTGQDLVEWQLKVAHGQTLPLEQSEIQISGHSFEVRVYAEDPKNEFLPASGKLEFLREPSQNQHVRIDSGIREHDVISNFYDPMISKLIVWDENRHLALQRMENALDNYRIVGLKHNIAFLRSIITHSAFVKADFYTDFIERYNDNLFTSKSVDPAKVLALAGLSQVLHRQQALQSDTSPWASLTGFRVNSANRQQVRLLDDDNQLVELNIIEQSNGYEIKVGEQIITINGELASNGLLAQIGDHRFLVPIAQIENDFTLFIDNQQFHFKAVQAQQLRQEDNSEDQLNAPMNGTIVTHLVDVGAQVKAGQGLMVMEAMKMEYTIQAPFDGVVSEFFFHPGDLVTDGSPLLDVNPNDALDSKRDGE
ncbi:acetyl/propionyl/methylcrotonyl-CoA carboxylase subunit alpha [Parashewanella spongiae]|uniref:Biotin carboxylase n=1 Tax=Parashewanella spongiae TaxID=342950 RepID=A0A3A6TFM2_9GAMM|nr:acetyl/propionyl/methylcrotonyl-CoA carboxylase subunit alpha [Parashewanella spongiae]MCL1079257.1 acetyl/propionyl/methylcrotonyl-CoA carboxylase subunit alpha [Parashewanella spongiae]RJY07892.1 acetyl/propionyl/methylcrotonyl-CoA carboxylase subunit alpha [Parashewanella spongiae]